MKSIYKGKRNKKEEEEEENGGTHLSFASIKCFLNNHKDLVISIASQTLESAVHEEGQFIAFASKKYRQLYLLRLFALLCRRIGLIYRPIGLVF